MGWEDDRGVSEVLGAMLLFGIVIVALGGYQAFVVPQQNAEVEMHHNAQVDDEFAGIQSAISNAAATGTHRTTSVTLGTRYPVRAAALNPPSTAGQIETGTAGEITATGLGDTSLTEICGATPETRAITYRANYYEQDDVGALTYENGVTYRDAGTNTLVRSEQELVDGSTIRLFPLTKGDFSTSSTSSKQLRFVPGTTGVTRIRAGADGLQVTIPTRLDDATWEDEILAGEHVAGVDGNGDGTVTIQLVGETTYTIRCTPIGIGSAPSQDTVPRSDQDPKAGVGGESTWSEDDTTQTFSASNGRWSGLDIGSINLSDGQTVDKVECTEGTNPANEGECTNVDRLYLRFILDNDASQYTVDVLYQDADQDGDIEGATCVGTGENERCIPDKNRVVIYDESGSIHFEGEFTDDDALLSDTVNLLDADRYESGDQTDLDDLKLTDATWVTADMEGRIAVTVEPPE